jgi:putative transposase
MDFRRKNIRLPSARYRGRAWFFITICCEKRRPVFSNIKYAQQLIAHLIYASEKYKFGVHAYCVMPDHFHALVEGISPDSDLLLFTRFFKQTTSREYSAECGTPLWQKNFYDHILRPKDSPETVAWYIWMNPVRNGLCNQPHQYPYSSSCTKQWEIKLQPRDLWVPPWKIGRVDGPS